MDARLVTYLREVEAQIEGLRAELRARYGWTHIALELELDVARGVLVVEAELAVAKLAEPVRATLEAMLFEGLTLELHPRVLEVQSWYGVPRAGLELWAEHPSRSTRNLATELEASDGPVGHLAHDGPGMLLRTRDGTVGWATGILGPQTEARPLTGPRPPTAPSLEPARAPGEQICAAARDYLGTPYLLGGASRNHIDCSALVQRAYLRGVELLVPRNSRDQLAVAGGGSLRGTTEGAPGDLLFIRSRRMQRIHVGILAGEGRILHASRTHAAVIEQPAVEFQLDAEWIRHVGRAQLCAWGQTQVGRESVELPAPT